MDLRLNDLKRGTRPFAGRDAGDLIERSNVLIGLYGPNDLV
jgi:hypothetical protein